MKKYIGLVMLFQSISLCNAIQISEIMYDPSGSDTGHEWIEVYNDTENAIDLKTLKLFENSTNHGITFVSGNDMLNKGEYAVIADNAGFFSVDNPSFVSSLFDSAFSLSNSGESLEIKSGSGESFNKVTYTPVPESNGTGNTISLINGQWVKSQSTPGLANIEFSGTVATSTGGSNSTTTSQNNNTYTSGTGYIPTSKRTYMLGDINMLTNKEVYSTVGAESYFEIRNSDSRNQNITGTVYWSFGDGSGGIGATSTHVYQNSGDFVAFVEVENSNVYGIDRLTVHVRDPKLNISSTSTGVIVRNYDEEDIDIGNFYIACENGMFRIARHLLISKQNMTVINNKNLGFDCRGPKLLFPNNGLVSNYQGSIFTPMVAGTSTVKKVLNNKVKYKVITKSNPEIVSSSPRVEMKTASTNVEKPVASGVKKWLYWLYE